MNRQLTLLFAAFEALLVAAIGIAIPLVPLTLLWGIQYGLAVDWAVFWRVAIDCWLLGHGVDVTLTLDAASAAQLGFPAAGAPFVLTIAPLGFALLTVLLGIRAGRRVAETRYGLTGELASLATFAAVAFVLTASAQHPGAQVSLVQGIVLPTLVFALGSAIGVRRTRALLDRPPTLVRQRAAAWVGGWPVSVKAVLGTSLRGGAAAVAAVMAFAALVTAATLALSYARIISLYEGLHTEVLGGVTVTLGQLALLPNAVIWAASWLIGPGFAVGTGSQVSPLATQLGPIPAVPFLGALPDGALAFGFVGILVPVVSAFLVGAVLGPRVRDILGLQGLALVAVGIGLTGGVLLGALAWASAGSAAPGRLVDVGPDPLAVGAWAALEFAVASLVGLWASAHRAGAGPRGDRLARDQQLQR